MNFGKDQIAKIAQKNIRKLEDPSYAKTAKEMLEVISGQRPVPSRTNEKDDKGIEI